MIFSLFFSSSVFLGNIKSAFDKNAKLANLLLDPFFTNAIQSSQASWRKVVAASATLGIPTPAFSTALAFYDGYRSARLPANLLQVSKDYVFLLVLWYLINEVLRFLKGNPNKYKIIRLKTVEEKTRSYS